MSLYHRDLGFPAGVSAPRGHFTIEYTRHARTEATRDRYAEIRLPAHVTLDGSETFELELDALGHPVKAVVRLAYDAVHDICLVLRPAGVGRVACVTVWLNKRTDNHSTIKYGRYVRP